VIGAIAGVGVGAGTVVAAVNESPPDTSRLPFPATQRKDNRVSDWELYGGLAAGLGGALVGALAGHYLCDASMAKEKKQADLSVTAQSK
jgi:hypothetical protein